MTYKIVIYSMITTYLAWSMEKEFKGTMECPIIQKPCKECIKQRAALQALLKQEKEKKVALEQTVSEQSIEVRTPCSICLK